jgi:hypothetical protein
VRYTSVALNTQIKDNTCVCHKLNNLIKRIVGDYFGEHYLEPWRLFIKRTNKSHPFREAWFRCCEITYGEPVILQIDTPTRLFSVHLKYFSFIHSFLFLFLFFNFFHVSHSIRWSSTVAMLEKAVKVQDAIFLMPGVISNRDEDHDALPSWGDRDSTMWILLQQIVELFSPTITAIKALEGQHYVTQSLIILQCKSLFFNFLIF